MANRQKRGWPNWKSPSVPIKEIDSGLGLFLNYRSDHCINRKEILVILEKRDIAIALKWYCTYSLNLPVQCTNVIDRIDQWSLLTRLAVEPFPLVLNGNEAVIMARWLSSDPGIAAGFLWLPHNEKELLRKTYSMKYSLDRQSQILSPGTKNRAQATSHDGINQGKTLLVFFPWWKKIMIKIKWVIHLIRE
jgi:hypothetical protein